MVFIRSPQSIDRFAAVATALLLTACTESGPANPLEEVPELESFCVAAQQVVTKTKHPVQLVVHDNFTAFVKSKAVIEGPEIQQYNWQDDTGNIVGISCKLKSADHLNLEFGAGTAGPDGSCQEMNQAIFMLIAPTVGNPVFQRVTFDPNETVSNEANPGMTGPDWLAPYTATSVDDAGELTIRSKGFIVNFTDPQYAQAPPRFRGVHYCHFLAPEYMQALLVGAAEPGVSIGRNPEGMGRGY